MGQDSSGDLKADVVIAGGGGGGLAAAELGASVIVPENRRTVGGNAVFAEGFFAAESPAQQRTNIDVRRDDMFRLAMESGTTFGFALNSGRIAAENAVDYLSSKTKRRHNS